MITTKRLILRQWDDADRQPFAQMSRDSRVMAHFPACLSQEESDKVATKNPVVNRRAWLGILGRRDPRLIEHPDLDPSDPLSEHVLYKNQQSAVGSIKLLNRIIFSHDTLRNTTIDWQHVLRSKKKSTKNSKTKP